MRPQLRDLPLPCPAAPPVRMGVLLPRITFSPRRPTVATGTALVLVDEPACVVAPFFTGATVEPVRAFVFMTRGALPAWPLTLGPHGGVAEAFPRADATLGVRASTESAITARARIFALGVDRATRIGSLGER